MRKAAPSVKHYLAVLKAVYDFEPNPGEEEELSIKENQILLLQERVDQQWWKVKVMSASLDDESPVGLVPAAYVQPATHTSVVKALYAYEACGTGELSITADQVLLVFDTEDDWLLVQTDEDGGKAGFVPANYVEVTSRDEDAEEAPPHVPSENNVVDQALVAENEELRTTMREMQEQLQELQASSSDVELQRIQYEDLVRENERLNKQVTEMRESTTQLPWSGGDSELQTLINEDLARENARLRVEARETQETVAQLQQGYEEQRKLNAELARDNEGLQELARTMRTIFDAQHRELSKEIQRLKMPARFHPSVYLIIQKDVFESQRNDKSSHNTRAA
ncbi:hypothetical protein B0H17DRAFT_1068392 [Mycena rosella]|uniref:SH3 domain-containing protein n=1 Tax=Mycena rosella TaxID=1033263 RepID=A0AAD7GHL5_MYCRO|nr:hypothetical protein B0H17DRAFT_1068392 [Mycena rosella]